MHAFVVANMQGLITYQPDSSYGAYYTCSGSLIGRFTVLTAAHCVVNRQTKQLPEHWMFSAGQTSAGSAVGTSTGVLFYFNSKYLTAADWWMWDLAVVVLDRPLGGTAGWLGFAWAKSGYTGGLMVAGYPSDKEEGSLWVQAQSSCRVQWNGVGSYLTHKCDTLAGSSGSAMFAAVPRARSSDSNGNGSDNSTGGSSNGSSGTGNTRNAAGPRFHVRAVHNAGTATTNSAMPVNRFWAGFLRQCSGATPDLPPAPATVG
jgi:V8-like Glu-specific endopeptidase